MIAELDESIRALLVEQGGLDPAEVDIRFEIPDRDWAATVSKPTVNCYLYDIRENRQLRDPGWLTERNGGGGGGIVRRKPPLRIDLSYLVTAWTKAVEDEHRLLWHVMTILFRAPLTPIEAMRDSLPEPDRDIPLPTSVAQAESALRSPGEFWSALDNKLKPSLNFVVTMPLDPEVAVTAPPVFDRDFSLRDLRPDAPPPGTALVSGVVRGPGGRGVAAARVLLVGTNRAVTADRDGHYALGPLPTGRHAVALSAPGGSPRERVLVVPSAGYDLEVEG